MGKLTPLRWTAALAAVVVIGIAWVQVWGATRGLSVRQWQQDGVPLRLVAPVDAAADAPAVLIAHGFSGSQQIMLGYAYALAHAGYTALLWDSAGHGAHATPLDAERRLLAANQATAYNALLAQPGVDPQRIALLGHSMGTGIVLRAALQHPERYRAVVAVSPTSANLVQAMNEEAGAERYQATAVPNLLLMAGAWEGQFGANAQTWLAASGGANDDFASGRARRSLTIPNVEHITILFAPLSHAAAVEWLDAVFGRSTASAYTDRRMVWYLAQLVAWLVGLTAVAPLWRSERAPALGRLGRPAAGLLLGSAAGIGVVALLDRLLPVAALGGLAVGGPLGLWMLAQGVVWLAIGGRALRPTGRLDGRAVAVGLLLFAALWAAFHALAHFVWTPGVLIAPRLWRWPLLAAALWPAQLAAAATLQGRSARARLGWWLLHSVVVGGGLLVTVLLVPSLGFLFLILPLLPLILGILTIAGAAVDRPWPVALGSALFFSWLLLSFFPLVE